MTKPPSGRSGSTPANDVPSAEGREGSLPEEADELQPFDPLGLNNLAISTAKALLERRARPLGDLPSFSGAGVYAIYYSGTHPAYEVIAAENQDRQRPRWPIYVGKAVPEGARRGLPKVAAAATNALFKRLRDHRESIQAAPSLRVDDFLCRFLIVHHLWIPLTEQLLITFFAPVWNQNIDGFGNHDPGSGRHEGLCPRWDVLHPGRPWAAKLKPRAETASDIQREVRQHLASTPVPSLADLSGGYSLMGKVLP